MNSGQVTTSLSLGLLVYEVEPELQGFGTEVMHTENVVLGRAWGGCPGEVRGPCPSSQLGQGRAQAEEPREAEYAGVNPLLPLLPVPSYPRPQGHITLATFKPGVSQV